MADCCAAEPVEAKPPAQPSGSPPDAGEAQAKAAEYNEKVGEAKKNAEADGTAVPAEPDKPSVAAPPSPTTPAALPSGTPKDAGEPKKAAPAKPAAHPAAKGKPSAGGPAPGPAAGGAQASVDAEVAEFFKKSAKDPQKEAVNANVKQIVEAAASLAANAPPIGQEKAEAPEQGNISKLSDAITGDNNPYKDIGGKYGKWIQTLSRFRDAFSAVSGILGTIGTVVSIVGLVIMVTGIGAPLGGPLETIGNVITIISLVLDALTMVLSGIIQGLLGLTFASTPDTATRKKLAGMIKTEAANTAQALLAVVMALPGVNKLAEMGLSKLKGLVTSILSKVGKGIAAAVGPLAKRVLAATGRGLSKMLGKGAGTAEKAALKATEQAAEKSAMSKAASWVGKKAETGAAYAMKGANSAIEGVGKGVGKARDYLNPKIGAFVEKAGETWAGKGAKAVGGAGDKMTKWVEKWSGTGAVEKLGNSMDYYAAKFGNKAEAAGERAGAGQAAKAAEAAERAEAAAKAQAELGVDSNLEKSADKTASKSADDAGKSAEKTELTDAQKYAQEKAEAKAKVAADAEANKIQVAQDQMAQAREKAPDMVAADEKIQKLQGVEKRTPDEEKELADAKNEMSIFSRDKQQNDAFKDYKKAESAAMPTKPPPDLKAEYDRLKKNIGEIKEYANGESATKYMESQNEKKDSKQLEGEAGDLIKADQKIKDIEAVPAKARSDEEKQALTDAKNDMTILSMDKQKKASFEKYAKVKKAEEEKTASQSIAKDLEKTDEEVAALKANKNRTYEQNGELGDLENEQKILSMDKGARGMVDDKAEKEAGERAEKRLAAAEKGQLPYDGDSDPDLLNGKGKYAHEFKDSFSYKGAAEKQEKSLGHKAKEVMEEAKGGNEKEIEEKQEEEEKKKELHEALEEQKNPKADQAREQAEALGPEPEKPPAAPALPGGEGKGETRAHVSSLVGDLKPQSKTDAETKSAPAPGGQPSENPGGGEETKADGGGDAGGGDAGGGGQIPYWPELLTEYQSDLTQLGTVESQLAQYKAAQLAGYEKAVGIETEAGKKGKEAESRGKPTEENAANADQDGASLTGFSGANKGVSGKGDEANSKKGEAQGPGDSAASASNAEVPNPPSPGFWGGLMEALNVIKNYILGLLAKGMAYIQDAITKTVMGLMGLDPAQIKQITDCMAGKAEGDAETSKESSAETKEGGAKDGENKSKAESTQTEAQQLQTKTKGNIDSANELLGTVAQLKTQLTKEIAAGSQYLSQVNAAVAAEKKQQEEKAKAEEKKQAEGEKGAAGDKDHKDDPDGKKDHADPAQVAHVKAAAMVVKEADQQNSAKLREKLGAGKANISGGRAAGVNAGAVAQAAAAFDSAGADATGQFQASSGQRAGQLDGVTVNANMSTAELSDAAGKIEQAAGESDDSFHQAASEIESNYQQAYQAAHTMSGERSAHG